jgi:hypothetical protein
MQITACTSFSIATSTKRPIAATDTDSSCGAYEAGRKEGGACDARSTACASPKSITTARSQMDCFVARAPRNDGETARKMVWLFAKRILQTELDRFHGIRSTTPCPAD